MGPPTGPESSEGAKPSAAPAEKVEQRCKRTEKEIYEYAEWLGMKPEEDADLLWIAHQGLQTPLPKPWKACESSNGDIFYYNPVTNASSWDHPCDEELRQLYASERAKKKAKQQPPAAPGPAPRASFWDVAHDLATPKKGEGGDGLSDLLKMPLDLDGRGGVSEQMPLGPADAPEPVPPAPLTPLPPPIPPLPPTPPAAKSSPAHPEQAGEGSAEPAPSGGPAQLAVPDIPSPPTPHSRSILAAELQPEEQLSLWSQIEEAPEKSDAPHSAKTLEKVPRGSLDLSSLSAVLEQSNHGPGDVGRSMVEELQRMEQADPPTMYTARDLRALQSELAAKARECDELRDVLGRAGGEGARGLRGGTLAEDCTPLAGRGRAAPAEALGLGASDETTGSGSTGTGVGTMKLHARWDQAKEAEAGVHRVEGFRAELGALAARVQAMEAARSEDASMGARYAADQGDAVKLRDTLKDRHADAVAAHLLGDRSGRDSLGAEAEGRHSRRWAEVTAREAPGSVRHRTGEEHGEPALPPQARDADQEQLFWEACIRERQRDILQLRSQLQHRDGGTERTAGEAPGHSDPDHEEGANHHLQLQLRACDAELQQLRVQTALNRQRAELQQREQLVNDRDRFLDERERLIGEAELRLQKQQRELRADVQRAELGSLRVALSDNALPSPWHQATGLHASSAKPRTKTSGDCSAATKQPSSAQQAAAALKRHSGSDSQIGFAPPSPVLIDARADEQPSSDANHGAWHGSHEPARSQNGAQCFDAHVGAASAASSTLSLREIRDCCDITNDDAGEDVRAILDQHLDMACFNAQSLKEMTEILRVRRHELRSEHAELEESRRKWRCETRRVHKNPQGSSQADVEYVAETRVVLDARAAALNKSIAEHRALEQLLSGHKRRMLLQASGDAGHAAPLWGTSRTPLRAHPGAGAAHAATPRASMRPGSKEEKLFGQWQYILKAQHEPQASALHWRSGNTLSFGHGAEADNQRMVRPGLGKHRAGARSRSCSIFPCTSQAPSGGA